MTATEFGGATIEAGSRRRTSTSAIAATTATRAAAAPASSHVRRPRPWRVVPGADGLRLDGGSIERRVLVEHGPLERPELGPRLDPEVLDRRLARRPVGGERVGLAAGPVEREHLLGPEPLAVRMVGGERIELRHERRVAPELEVGVDPLLERGEPELLEAQPRRDPERLTVELRERRAAPQRECLVEQGRPLTHVPRRARFVAQRGEAVEVERAVLDGEHITGRPRCQRGAARSECLPKTRDVHLERRPRRLGGRVAPQLVDQRLGRDDAVRVEEQ